MPSVDELLLNGIGTLDDEESFEETNKYCEIDETGRVIVLNDLAEILGVENDKAVERVYFRCPRYVGDNVDLDLKQCTVYINFQNANMDKDQYIVTDLNTDETDSTKVTFSWLLSKKVTQYKGIVNFIVCARKTKTGGEIEQEWNTTLARATVLEGLEPDPYAVPSDDLDVVNQLMGLVKEEIEQVGDEVIASIPSDYTTLTNKVEDLEDRVGYIEDVPHSVENNLIYTCPIKRGYWNGADDFESAGIFGSYFNSVIIPVQEGETIFCSNVYELLTVVRVSDAQGDNYVSRLVNQRLSPVTPWVVPTGWEYVSIPFSLLERFPCFSKSPVRLSPWKAITENCARELCERPVKYITNESKGTVSFVYGSSQVRYYSYVGTAVSSEMVGGFIAVSFETTDFYMAVRQGSLSTNRIPLAVVGYDNIYTYVLDSEYDRIIKINRENPGSYTDVITSLGIKDFVYDGPVEIVLALDHCILQTRLNKKTISYGFELDVATGGFVRHTSMAALDIIVAIMNNEVLYKKEDSPTPTPPTPSQEGYQWNGKKWYAYGTSLTSVAQGKYVPYVSQFSGLVATNKGIPGGGLVHNKNVYNALMSETDGKEDADLITIEVGANDASTQLGEVTSMDTNTLFGALNTCLKHVIQFCPKAQIVLMSSPHSRYALGGSASDPYTLDEELPGGYTLAERDIGLRKVAMANGIYYIPMADGLGLGLFRQLDGNKYNVDNIHQTDLGGYNTAVGIWQYLKMIPLWYTQIPSDE